MPQIPHDPTPEKRYRHAVTEKLSDTELQILVLLRNAPPHGLSIRQLQQELSLPVSNIRHMCNRLKEQGLLHIKDDPDSCTGSLYTVTAFGLSLRL